MEYIVLQNTIPHGVTHVLTLVLAVLTSCSWNVHSSWLEKLLSQPIVAYKPWQL